MPNEKKTITQIKRTLESVVGNELIPGRDENGDFKIEIQKLLLGNDIRGYEHTVDPIAYYTEHTEDYELKVGEVAKIDFDVSSSPYNVPLRIKTMDGTYYEFHLIPANTGGTSGTNVSNYLLPNNTIYTNKFVYVYMVRSTGALGDGTGTDRGMIISAYYSSSVCFITNRTIYKDAKAFTNTYGINESYPKATIMFTSWRDTTTEWTSLGTVQFGCAQKGAILIRRLL